MKKLFCLLLMVLIFVGATACGASEKDFIGSWTGYKMGTQEDGFVDLTENPGMFELSMSFQEDGTYTWEFLTLGLNVSNRPNSGTYTIEDGKAILSGDAVAEIKGDDLIVTYAEPYSVQYFKKD